MWTRSIQPRWLREKIFWHWTRKRNLPPESAANVPLEFCPSIRLDLQATCISHREIAAVGYTEYALSKAIRDLARTEGGLLVDVGANWGYFSCLWAGTAPAGKVISFEASPRNIPGLAANIARNKLADRVRICALALGNKEGELQFDPGPAHQSGWGGFAPAGNPRSLSVKVTTLDQFFAAEPAEIAALKIDTEGADTWVIQGARELLRAKRIRRIFYEENATRMRTLGIPHGQARKILEDAGYTVEEFDPASWHAYLPGCRADAAFH